MPENVRWKTNLKNLIIHVGNLRPCRLPISRFRWTLSAFALFFSVPWSLLGWCSLRSADVRKRLLTGDVNLVWNLFKSRVWYQLCGKGLVHNCASSLQFSRIPIDLFVSYRLQWNLYQADAILLSGHLPQSQTCLPIFTVKRTCIQRTPLLSGHADTEVDPKSVLSRPFKKFCYIDFSYIITRNTVDFKSTSFLVLMRPTELMTIL